VPPSSCPASEPKPSFLLALVCAAIVRAYDPSWLTQSVAARLSTFGLRPEHISRLKARLLAGFERLLREATRRGRPPSPSPPADAAAAAIALELLPVATELLRESRVPWRNRRVQDRLVAAYDRLRASLRLKLVDFCAALALSPRTFRGWRSRPPAPAAVAPAPAPPPPRRRRDRHTGRFALEVTAPDTQLGVDTTSLRLFGVDLKLVAAQDIGAREQRLWDAFAIDERETADLITGVLAEAAAGRPGLQAITDQGTPYLAEATRQACEQIGLEHTPQKEGSPTAKATVERAFLTVKAALAPLLELTNRLADSLPTLRNPQLARAAGTLLCAVFLRVYLTGRTHLQHPLLGQDPDAVRAIIEAQREAAHAELRSKRLFLEGIHAQYDMPRSKEAFVRAFRHYPLEDLREAERRCRRYACRCQTRLCDRYFAAVVRQVHEQGRARRAAEQNRRRANAARRAEQEAACRDLEQLRQNPERQLLEGLTLLADTWLPSGFIFDGTVPREVYLEPALRQLRDRFPDGAHDEAERIWRGWLEAKRHIPLQTQQAVRGALTQVISNILGPQPTPRFPSDFVGAMLPSAARAAPDNQRPLPPRDLRI